MNHKLALAVFFVLFWAGNQYSHAQDSPPESPPNPYWNEVAESHFQFTYLSDADQEHGSTWYYEREIQNLHEKRLKVRWCSVKPTVVLIDGFASPNGESSDKIVNNAGGLGVYRSVESKIEYGRTTLVKEKKTDAYIAEEESSSHNPLNPVWSVVKMALYYRDQKFLVDMKLISKVENGRYFYSIINQSEGDIHFRWNSALSPEFLRQTEVETIFLRGNLTQEVIFHSTAKPTIRSGSIIFLHPKIKDVELGSALAPALVPSQ